MRDIGVHWFRRDLRTTGNSALAENLEQHEGRVLGLFCFDSQFLSRSDFSHSRFAFFLKTLEALKKELSDLGGDLLVVDELPKTAFPRLLNWINGSKNFRVSTVSFNRDYEPFARARDQEISRLLEDLSVAPLTARDHLLIEPAELLKDDGSSYQVYTPYARRWFEMLKTSEIQARIKAATKKLPREFQIRWSDLSGPAPWDDSLKKFESVNKEKVMIQIPEAGSITAREVLRKFAPKAKAYKADRDEPAKSGTSGLSIFLKNGSLTTAQVIAALKLEKETFGQPSGPNQFLKELVWREFYYSVLFHHPRVEKEAFIEKYKAIKWENDKELFHHWCQGTTGFPIVDAGMRQLNQTGWMHNRVRMIVASFLTKDLLINWQWGENYFMKVLLDGDLAPNNGGWQWAASTGCDPQPYFRIFNPWLQGQKFDPEAAYIKKYIPELKKVSAKDIHKPDGARSVDGYPDPVVDHKTQTQKAIRLYKSIR